MKIDQVNNALTEYKTTDFSLQKEKPEQFRRDFKRRSSIIVLAILFVIFAILNQVLGSPFDRLKWKTPFIRYATLEMHNQRQNFVEENWPGQFSDDLGEWKFLDADPDILTVEQAATELLGENLLLLEWSDLLSYLSESLWNEWKASNSEITPHQFIEDHVQQYVLEKTVPNLKHDNWLVITESGEQFLLCKKAVWCVCPLRAITEVGFVQK